MINHHLSAEEILEAATFTTHQNKIYALNC